MRPTHRCVACSSLPLGCWPCCSRGVHRRLAERHRPRCPAPGDKCALRRRHAVRAAWLAGSRALRRTRGRRAYARAIGQVFVLENRSHVDPITVNGQVVDRGAAATTSSPTPSVYSYQYTRPERRPSPTSAEHPRRHRRRRPAGQRLHAAPRPDPAAGGGRCRSPRHRWSIELADARLVTFQCSASRRGRGRRAHQHGAASRSTRLPAAPTTPVDSFRARTAAERRPRRLVRSCRGRDSDVSCECAVE